MYSDKLVDHAKNPRNMGEMDDADALGEAEDPISKDLIYVYLKIKDGNIFQISFQTYGSAISLACSSILTELVKGKTLQEADKITANDLVIILNDVPKKIMPSCNLAINGLHAAIKNYYEK